MGSQITLLNLLKWQPTNILRFGQSPEKHLGVKTLHTIAARSYIELVKITVKTCGFELDIYKPTRKLACPVKFNAGATSDYSFPAVILSGRCEFMQLTRIPLTWPWPSAASRLYIFLPKTMKQSKRASFQRDSLTGHKHFCFFTKKKKNDQIGVLRVICGNVLLLCHANRLYPRFVQAVACRFSSAFFVNLWLINCVLLLDEQKKAKKWKVYGVDKM